MVRTAMDKLGDVSSQLAEGFRTLRSAASHVGPLHDETVELIVVGALAATRQHAALRSHMKRLLAADVDPAAIKHAVVAGLCASTTVTAACEALDLLDSLTSEDQS